MVAILEQPGSQSHESDTSVAERPYEGKHTSSSQQQFTSEGMKQWSSQDGDETEQGSAGPHMSYNQGYDERQSSFF